MNWYYYMDMCSGGGQKTDYGQYFIEAADENQARKVFMGETGRDPDHVTCSCCGSDFDGPSKITDIIFMRENEFSRPHLWIHTDGTREVLQ